MAASSDFAYARPASPYFGGFPVPRGVVGGSSGYHHAVPYGYQQAYPYPPFGYTAYGPEYVYPQNVFNPYTGYQYVQVYGLPGAANTAVYPFGQLGQPVPSGHGYTTIQGYTVPGQHILQLSGPSVNGVTAAPLPTIQAPYPTGAPPSIPAQPQFFVSAPSPQFTQGSGSDQTAS